MKLKKVILGLIAVLSVCSCNNTKNQTDVEPTEMSQSVTINGFEKNDDEFNIKVDNNVDTFSFINKVNVPSNYSWKLFEDFEGQTEIITKTIRCNVGSNIVFLLVLNDIETIGFYKVNVYRLNMFRVSFNTFGGTTISPQNVQEGSLVQSVNDPVREGYEFLGWSYDFSQPVLSNLVINALWQGNHYTVSLNSAGDSSFVDYSIDVTYGSSYNLPSPHRNGYEFNGWYCGDEKFSSSGIWRITHDVSLVATWSIIVYSIQYNLDGGTNSLNNPTTYTIEDEIVLNDAVNKTGYSFVSWECNGVSINKISQGTYGNLILDAVWSVNNYNVVVTSENITRGSVSGSGSYEFNSIVSINATPSNGYSFVGWYIGSNKVSDIANYQFTLSDHDVSIEARWSIITYSIEYVFDGGEEGAANPTTYTIEDEIVLNDAVNKTGYSFVSWSLNNSLVSTIPAGTFGDITLIAIWDIDSYNVTGISTNSLKGSVVGSGSYEYNSKVVLHAVPLENCLFKGWYSDIDLKVKLSDSEDYEILVGLNDVTIYAHFLTQQEENQRIWDINHGVTPTICDNGKSITYGLYPKTCVDDGSLISELDQLTTTDINGWYRFNDEFYTKIKAKPYNNDHYFDNGEPIVINEYYWYKCEPIKWNILDTDDNKYLVLSENILDQAVYHNKTSATTHGDETIYPNNYKESSIRSFLNGTFYNTAFRLNDIYVSSYTCDNSVNSTNSMDNQYWCADTEDKVTLLSYQDCINPNYGFEETASYSQSRKCKSTDYSRSRGVYAWSGNYSCYWTRTPHSDDMKWSWFVDSTGWLITGGVVSDTIRGIRPLISIELD